MLSSFYLASCRLYGAEPLINAGFEDPIAAMGWEVNTFGAVPRIEPDIQVFHQGKQSLRVSADEASDTALAQEVTLQPGNWYRFSGWKASTQRGHRSRGRSRCNGPKAPA